jgi:hypothetical protein
MNINEIEHAKQIDNPLLTKEGKIKKHKKKTPNRISPQLSCTLDERTLQFLKDMTIFFSAKKRKAFSYSQTLRVLLKYCKEFEHELQEYV